MAVINEARKKVESGFFHDLWEFRKKYGTVEEAQMYWDYLIDEADALSQKNGRDHFFDTMMLAMIDSLEAELRVRFGNRHNYNADDYMLFFYNGIRKARNLPEVAPR